MSQTGNPDQVGKALGLRIQKHLNDKFRSKLRDSQRSQWAAVDLIRRDAKRRRILEQAHDLRIVQRDLRRVNARQILQHPDHRRIIVSQNIQL